MSEGVCVAPLYVCRGRREWGIVSRLTEGALPI